MPTIKFRNYTQVPPMQRNSCNRAIRVIYTLKAVWFWLPESEKEYAESLNVDYVVSMVIKRNCERTSSYS
jgi:hypothetical protein